MTLNDFIDDDDRESDGVESSSDEAAEAGSTVTETLSRAASRIEERAPEAEDIVAMAERVKHGLTVALVWIAGALRGLVDVDDLPRSLDEVPLSPEQLKIIGAVTGLLLASVLAPMVLLPGGPSAAPDGNVTTTPEPKTGSVIEAQEGAMTPVPDSHLSGQQVIPAPNVQASQGSQTMSVGVRQRGGEPVLVLTDDETHEGRWVAIPTAWLETHLGKVPEAVTVRHESGDVDYRPVSIENKRAEFYIDEFSTNTIEFSGETTVTADGVANTSTTSYQLTDTDSVSNASVEFTGHETSHSEIATATLAGGSGTLTTSVAGNRNPDGNQPTTGSSHADFGTGGEAAPKTTSDVTVSGTGDSARVALFDSYTDRFEDADKAEYSGDTGAVSVQSSTVNNGSHALKIEPGGEETISSRSGLGAYPAQGDTFTYWVRASGGNSDIGSVFFATQSETSTPHGYRIDVADRLDNLRLVRVDSGGSTVLTTDSIAWSQDWYKLSVDFGSNGDITVTAFDSAGTQVAQVSDTDTNFTSGGIGYRANDVGTSTSETYYFDAGVNSPIGDGTYLSANHSVTDSEQAAVNISTLDNMSATITVRDAGSGTVLNQTTVTEAANHTVTWATASASDVETNVTVEKTGAGPEFIMQDERILTTTDTTTAVLEVRAQRADASSVNVTLTNGTTRQLGSISEAKAAYTTVNPSAGGDRSYDLTWSGSGDIETRLHLAEQTTTDGASLLVNGNATASTGKLTAGQTESESVNESWITTNTTLELRVDDTLSADAPTMRADYNLTHDSTDKRSVDFDEEQFQEGYNVSITYSSEKIDASLRIPFDGNVISIDTIEYRINESGGWASVSSSDYTLDQTELTADLDEIYGGDIPAGTIIEIRTDGTKVTTNNGSISVLEPTVVGNSLDTEIQVDSKSDGFYVGVGGTPRGARIHYLANESWSTTDEYTVHESNGDTELHLPNAGAGSTANVRTVPVEVSPASGDVRLSVTNTSSSEPAFSVREADSADDTVQYTFLNAKDDTKYLLYSQTNDVVRDNGTANSPLTLEDDDSAEKLKFLIDDGGSTSSGGSDGGGGGGAPIPGPGKEGFVPNIVLLMIVFGTIAGIVVISRRDEEITNAGEETADGIEAAVKQVPVLGPGVGRPLAGFVQSASQLARFVLGNRTVALAMATGLGFGAIQAGLIQLPEGSLNAIILAAIGILSLFGLRELDLFTRERWAAIMLASTLVTLQVTSQSETSLLQSIVESQVWPVIAGSGIYLAYKAVKAIQQPDEVTTVEIQTDGGQSEDEES